MSRRHNCRLPTLLCIARGRSLREMIMFPAFPRRGFSPRRHSSTVASTYLRGGKTCKLHGNTLVCAYLREYNFICYVIVEGNFGIRSLRVSACLFADKINLSVESRFLACKYNYSSKNVITFGIIFCKISMIFAVCCSCCCLVKRARLPEVT